MQKISLLFLVPLFISSCTFTEEKAAMPPSSPTIVQTEAKPPHVLSEEEIQDLWLKASSYAPQHKVLEQFLGTYATTSTMYSSDGSPPEATPGMATISPLFDGRFIAERFISDSSGARFEGMGLTGYDTMEDRYTSYWIDSMNTASLIMTGTYDSSARAIRWSGTRYDPFTQARIHVRATTKIRRPGEHSYTMEEKESDGTWKTTLSVTYVVQGR